MSGYLDRPSILSGWRLPAGIVGALVFVAAACTPRQVTADDIARDIANDREVAPVVVAFRAHYPREFAAMLQRLADVSNNRGRSAAAAAWPRELQDFLQSKTGLVARAPAADLSRIAAALVTAITELQRRDVALCAQFVTRGIAPGRDVPDGPKQALIRIAALQIEAARHVESGQGVDRGAVSPADGQLWYERISAISPELAPMIDDGSIERATISRQCQAGLTIYQAVRQLPEPAAANVTAHLIRESARAGGR